MQHKTAALIVFWIALAAVYVWAGGRQAQRLNVSATAGGQFPCLDNARSVATEGDWHGDRNRMPLVPVLLSALYEGDWLSFVERCKTFAIVSSLIALACVAAVAYALLGVWEASVLTLAAMICAWLPKSSFVQAELIYYALFLITWICMCRVIMQPTWAYAAVAGALAAICFYAKASVTLLVGLFAVTLALRGLTASRRKREWTRPLFCLATTLMSFGLIAGPYLWDNYTRFNRPFYNVNSTFYFWCDSWKEAKTFEKANELSERWPDQPNLPGPVTYFKTHSLSDAMARLVYGLKMTARNFFDSTFAKYVIALLILAIWRRRVREAGEMPEPRGWLVAFCLVGLVAYVIAYAWYAVVAFGDRFVQSLYLPVLFGALWWGKPRQSATGVDRRVRIERWFLVTLCLALTVEGVELVRGKLFRPTEHFVRFYTNESRERELVGDKEEAVRGYKGAILLMPSFAPPYHALGALELHAGRTESALPLLERAVSLSPDNAGMINTYAGALAGAGDFERAIPLFRKSCLLDPAFAMAWFNLGGCLLATDRLEEAGEVYRKLTVLDPVLADGLLHIWPEARRRPTKGAEFDNGVKGGN